MTTLEKCGPFRVAAIEGRIVYTLNYVISPDTPDQWNLDLVVGPPTGGLEHWRLLSLRVSNPAGSKPS